MTAGAFQPNFRIVFWAVVGLVLAAALTLALRPRPVPVDLGEVTRGPLTVVVRDEGKTRARDLYVISAPVGGRLLRIGNRVGERVEAGAVIATMQPAPAVFVDERSRTEARAQARAAEAAVALAEAELEGALARLAQARLEAGRAETLFAAAVISQGALDRARVTASTAAAAVDTARAAIGVRRADLQAARARLIEPGAAAAADRAVVIRAPKSGRVLRVMQESEAVVAQGAPLIEIGDPADLEVVAELLSSDAARIAAGASAAIDAWGAGPALGGRVRLVEPYGFLKISALGVEEQRVNVVIDPVGAPATWRAVGHGYRVEVAVTVWRSSSVVRVPVAALFRDRGRWAVFAVERGRARLRPVEIDHNDGDLAEVRAGLRPGERVVLHPSLSITDGGRVQPRQVGA